MAPGDKIQTILTGRAQGQRIHKTVDDAQHQINKLSGVWKAASFKSQTGRAGCLENQDKADKLFVKVRALQHTVASHQNELQHSVKELQSRSLQMEAILKDVSDSVLKEIPVSTVLPVIDLVKRYVRIQPYLRWALENRRNDPEGENQAFEAAHAQNKRYCRALKRLKKERSSQSGEYDRVATRLRAKRDKLQHQNNELKAKALASSQLQQDNGGLQSSVSNLTNQVVEMGKTIRSLEQDVRDHDAQVQADTSEITRLRSENSRLDTAARQNQLRADLKARDAVVNQLRAEVVSLTKTVDELTSTNRSKGCELRARAAAAREHEEVANQLRRQLAELKATVVARDATVAGLRQEVDAHKTKIEGIEADVFARAVGRSERVKELEAHNADQEQALTRLRSDVEFWDEQVRRLNKRLADQNQTVDTLNGDISPRDEQISDLNKTIASRVNEISNLTTETEKVNQLLLVVTRRINDLVLNNEKLAKQVQEAQRSAQTDEDTHQRQLKASKASFADARQQSDELALTLANQIVSNGSFPDIAFNGIEIWRPFLDALVDNSSRPTNVTMGENDAPWVSLEPWTWHCDPVAPVLPQGCPTWAMTDVYLGFVSGLWEEQPAETLRCLYELGRLLTVSSRMQPTMAQLMTATVIRVIEEVVSTDEPQPYSFQCGVGVCQALKIMNARWPGTLQEGIDRFVGHVESLCPSIVLSGIMSGNLEERTLRMADRARAVMGPGADHIQGPSNEVVVIPNIHDDEWNVKLEWLRDCILATWTEAE
ncbi:hypothetical protein OQA88_3315 [Cercophora sp. LCS_1]